MENNGETMEHHSNKTTISLIKNQDNNGRSLSIDSKTIKRNNCYTSSSVSSTPPPDDPLDVMLQNQLQQQDTTAMSQPDANTAYHSDNEIVTKSNRKIENIKRTTVSGVQKENTYVNTSCFFKSDEHIVRQSSRRIDPTAVIYTSGDVPRRDGFALYDFEETHFSQGGYKGEASRDILSILTKHEQFLARIRLNSPSPEEEYVRGKEIHNLQQRCEKICIAHLGFHLPKDLFDQCIFLATGRRRWLVHSTDTVDEVCNPTASAPNEKSYSNITMEEWEDPIFPRNAFNVYKNVIARELFGDSIGRPIPEDKKNMPSKVQSIITSTLEKASSWLMKFSSYIETEEGCAYITNAPSPDSLIRDHLLYKDDRDDKNLPEFLERFKNEMLTSIIDDDSIRGEFEKKGWVFLEEATPLNGKKKTDQYIHKVPPECPSVWRRWITQTSSLIDDSLLGFIRSFSTIGTFSSDRYCLSDAEIEFIYRCQTIMFNLLVCMCPIVDIFIQKTTNEILEAIHSYEQKMRNFVSCHRQNAQNDVRVEVKEAFVRNRNSPWNEEMILKYKDDEIKCRKAYYEKYKRLFEINQLPMDLSNMVIPRQDSLDKKPKSKLGRFLAKETRKKDIEDKNSCSQNAQEPSFEDAVYVMLKRYENVIYSPSHHTNSGNMHAAAPEKVFHFLKAVFNVELECFASPNNCFFPRFCSAFPDVDAAFGSMGSFFDLTVLPPGSYEVGPPYTEEMLLATIDHIEKIFSLTAKDSPLTLFLFVPDWSNCIALQRMKQSVWCTGDFEGPGRNINRQLRTILFQHIYVVGTQHRVSSPRSTRYYQPPHATKCFVLQNDAGKEKYPISSDTGKMIEARMQDKLNVGRLISIRKTDGIGLGNSKKLDQKRLRWLSNTGMNDQKWWRFISCDQPSISPFISITSIEKKEREGSQYWRKSPLTGRQECKPNTKQSKITKPNGIQFGPEDTELSWRVGPTSNVNANVAAATIAAKRKSAPPRPPLSNLDTELRKRLLPVEQGKRFYREENGHKEQERLQESRKDKQHSSDLEFRRHPPQAVTKRSQPSSCRTYKSFCEVEADHTKKKASEENIRVDQSLYHQEKYSTRWHEQNVKSTKYSCEKKYDYPASEKRERQNPNCKYSENRQATLNYKSASNETAVQQVADTEQIIGDIQAGMAKLTETPNDGKWGSRRGQKGYISRYHDNGLHAAELKSFNESAPSIHSDVAESSTVGHLKTPFPSSDGFHEYDFLSDHTEEAQPPPMSYVPNPSSPMSPSHNQFVYQQLRWDSLQPLSQYPGPPLGASEAPQTQNVWAVTRDVDGSQRWCMVTVPTPNSQLPQFYRPWRDESSSQNWNQVASHCFQHSGQVVTNGYACSNVDYGLNGYTNYESNRYSNGEPTRYWRYGGYPNYTSTNCNEAECSPAPSQHSLEQQTRARKRSPIILLQQGRVRDSEDLCGKPIAGEIILMSEGSQSIATTQTISQLEEVSRKEKLFKPSFEESDLEGEPSKIMSPNDPSLEGSHAEESVQYYHFDDYGPEHRNWAPPNQQPRYDQPYRRQKASRESPRYGHQQDRNYDQRLDWQRHYDDQRYHERDYNFEDSSGHPHNYNAPRRPQQRAYRSGNDRHVGRYNFATPQQGSQRRSSIRYSQPRPD